VQDAKARSDAIDRDIEKIRRRGLGAGAAGIESLPTLAGVGKEAQVIQLLLLGCVTIHTTCVILPSRADRNTEAGKSTFLRQMRMLYDRASLDREREAFRLAILLAIVTHSRFLLDLLEFSSPLPSPRSPLASPASSSSETNKSPVLLRRMRLAPLLALEDTLREHLGIVSVHAGASGATFAAHASAGRGVATTKRLGSSDGWRGTPPPSPSHPLAASGFYVRPDKWAALPTTTEDDETGNGRRAILARSRAPGKSDDPARLISGCSEEIANLWRDAVDQGLIAGEGVNVDGERGAVIAEGAS
jgi:guanine nucleotide-binding protein subunit alpha